MTATDTCPLAVSLSCFNHRDSYLAQFSSCVSARLKDGQMNNSRQRTVSHSWASTEWLKTILIFKKGNYVKRGGKAIEKVMGTEKLWFRLSLYSEAGLFYSPYNWEGLITHRRGHRTLVQSVSRIFSPRSIFKNTAEHFITFYMYNVQNSVW